MMHLGDITKINGADAPVVDCIIGGSPCQDLSIEGKGAGLAGERSKLYMDQIRIVKEMRAHGRKEKRTMKHTIEWHSVDEMLPDVSTLMDGEHEYVLVRYRYTDYCHGIGQGADITMCGFEKIRDGVASWDEDDSYGLPDTSMITHWAYLPDANDGEFERTNLP